MHSVPHKATETHTAVAAALLHCPALSGIGHATLEPGLLHRLDQGTSGLLVFAKSQLEFERLRKEWKQQKVEKVYRTWVAISSDEIPSLPLTLSTPLAHSGKSSKRMIAVRPQSRSSIRGKPLPAVTHLLKVHSRYSDQNCADLEIQIDTGVMHQIRCHLASVGLPILGDPIYGGKAHTDRIQTRLWLHAWRLTLPLQSGAILRLQSALPEGWNQPQ